VLRPGTLKKIDELMTGDGLKEGVAVNKDGKIVRVRIESIKDENDKLRIRNDKLQKDVDYWQEKAAELKMKNRELRLVAGLPPKEPQKKYHYDADGDIVDTSGEGYSEEIGKLRLTKTAYITDAVIVGGKNSQAHIDENNRLVAGKKEEEIKKAEAE